MKRFGAKIGTRKAISKFTKKSGKRMDGRANLAGAARAFSASSALPTPEAGRYVEKLARRRGAGRMMQAAC